MIIFFTFFIAESARAAGLAPWPAEGKAAAIAGCRLSITVAAERDYMKRANLKELPAGFREKVAPTMEPFLASCDCLMSELEKRWSFQDFSTRQSDVQPIVKEVMAGACAVRPAQPASPSLEKK